MSAPKKYPSDFGEWDVEIAAQSEANLLAYAAALQTLRRWEAFKGAFSWTRIFVLEQSIGFELDRRDKNAKA